MDALTRERVAAIIFCFAAGCGGPTGPQDGSTADGGDVAVGAEVPDTGGGLDAIATDTAGMDVIATDTAGMDIVGPTDGSMMEAGALDGSIPDVMAPDGGAMCGNSRLDMGEQCDTGAMRSDSVPGACRTNCQDASCGDRVVDYPREECDDGNTAAGDGCSATCQRERPPTCGDGRLDLAAGEQCDDNNTIAGDGCSPTCRFEPVGGAACGNSMRTGREVCDDGNTNNGDNCNPTCNLTNTTSRFAGNGTAGFMDGPVATAMFQGTLALATDATFLWIGDTGNRRLRRIDLTAAMPTVTTLAGNGTMGMVDNPNGLMASFGAFESIATDGRSLWVGDSVSRRIRVVSATAPHAVTTLSGTGTMGCVDGPSTMAQYNDIRGLTYYGGFLYYVDAACFTLRRIDPNTGTVVTLAGANGMPARVDGYGIAARFISPRYIASDNSGMLYISDTNGNQIRAYNTVSGLVSTVAGSGTVGYVDAIGTAAQIHRPRGMTSDGTSLYFNEFNQHTVRQVVLATRSVTTMVGMHCGGAATCAGGLVEGVGTAARLNGPWSIAFHYPSNSLFVNDSGNFLIRRIR